MKYDRTSDAREITRLKNRVSEVETENEDLTAVVKCDEQYINYINNQLKTERKNFQKQQALKEPHLGKIKFLLIILLIGLALNSTCIRLDFIGFIKTTGKITAAFLKSIGSVLIALAALLPYKFLQIIAAIPLFIIAYTAVFLIFCGAATGLYVIFKKYYNKFMGEKMLYVTTVFFIFADVLNINEHIGLNSVFLIFLINIGIFIGIALKRYSKDDSNNYNFKKSICKLIKALKKNPDNTPKATENSSSANKKSIESCDVAELVRKKYAKRQIPKEPKSDFAKAVKVIFK